MYGKGIHVGAECHRPFSGTGNVAQDTGPTGKACRMLDTGCLQLLLHDAAGSPFFVAEFRMGMQVVTDLCQARQILRYQVPEVIGINGGRCRLVRHGGDDTRPHPGSCAAPSAAGAGDDSPAPR